MGWLRTLQEFSTEDLLRELRLRDGVAIASWSLEDLEAEIEYRADKRGLELLDSAPITERAAEIITRLHDKLTATMIAATVEIIADESEQAVDDFRETGHAVESN